MSVYRLYIDDIPTKSLTNHCIVLDLDETLVHTYDNDRDKELDVFMGLGIFQNPQLMDLRNRSYRIVLDDILTDRGTGYKIELMGIMRPHLKEFLIFCFSYFKVVAVWSAGLPRYVEMIVDHIFKDVRPPHVIYCRDKCEQVGRSMPKPIIKMINEEDGLSEYMPLNETFILDDRDSAFASVNPGNGILIPGYEPDPTINSLRKDDIYLQMLMVWLMEKEVMECKDIRLLDKRHIFDKKY